MQRKKFPIIWLAGMFVLISCCAVAQDKFEIFGTSSDPQAEGRLVTLGKLDTFFKIKAFYRPVDTCRIKGGKFYFSKDLVQPNFYQLRVGPLASDSLMKNEEAQFVLNPGTLKVEFSKTRKPAFNFEEDDRLNRYFQTYQLLVNELLERRFVPRKIILEAGRKGIVMSEEIERLLKDEYSTIGSQLDLLTYNFILENIGNKLGAFEFINNGKWMTLTLEQLENVLDKVDTNTRRQHPELFDYLKNRVAVLNATAVGKKFTDLTGTDSAGNKIVVSGIVGKNRLTLIDFWASWCAPCIKDFPKLNELYTNYRKRGFEIIGVTLDSKKSDWLQALKSHPELTWPTMADFDSSLGDLYAVTSIPYTVLVDRSGKIVAKGLRPEKIKAELEKVFR